MSHLEGMLNKLVIFIVTVQIILSIIVAIASGIWQKNNEFDNLKLTMIVNGVIRTETQISILSFFTYFVLLNTLLPISLSVTLELVKVVQAYFINNDVLMYSWERDKLVKC